MELSAAVDFSTANAAFAVCKKNTDELIFGVTCPMSGREASSLLPWLVEQLDNYNYTMGNIKQWTCGSGPGSFTGLRIIASLVAGLTFDKKNIELRSVPSGTAIAEALLSPTEKTVVLYDGRRGEIISYNPNYKSSSTAQLTTISSNNVNQLNKFKTLCAMQSEKQAVEKILPQELTKKVKYLSEFPIKQLLLNKTYQWNKNAFFEPDLVYIRPPV